MPLTRAEMASAKRPDGGFNERPTSFNIPQRTSKRRRASSPHEGLEAGSWPGNATYSEPQPDSNASSDLAGRGVDERYSQPSFAGFCAPHNPSEPSTYFLATNSNAGVFKSPPAHFVPSATNKQVFQGNMGSGFDVVGPKTFIPPAVRAIDTQVGRGGQRLDSSPEASRIAPHDQSPDPSPTRSRSSDLDRLLSIPDGGPVPRWPILPLEEAQLVTSSRAPPQYAQPAPQIDPALLKEPAAACAGMGKSKGKATAKPNLKQQATVVPQFITLPRRDPGPGAVQSLSPFALPVASQASNSRPVRSSKNDINVTASWRTELHDYDGPLHACRWVGCDHEMPADALAIRRHYETVHWQAGVFLYKTALMIRCGWPGCRFSERGMRWDAYPRHVMTSHFDVADVHKCETCHLKEYKRKDALQRHQRDSCLRCERCGFRFDNMERLGQHLIERGKGKECEKKTRKRAKMES